MGEQVPVVKPDASERIRLPRLQRQVALKKALNTSEKPGCIDGTRLLKVDRAIWPTAGSSTATATERAPVPAPLDAQIKNVFRRWPWLGGAWLWL